MAARVGIVGCGNISDIYLQNGKEFSVFDIVAVADLFPERAAAKAEKYGVAKAYTVEQILSDPEVDLIINLTIPAAHGEVALAALAAGKHVYNEKPLAVSREDAQQMLQLAQSKGLRVGCAPDTFLGGGLQTCRKLIDDGAIGEPVAATAFMMSHGPESWHPDPEFFYQPGAGPMFDMGPYYLTTLATLLGPVGRVTGTTRVTFPERKITSQPKFGTMIKVNTPTHVVGVMEFVSGPVATLITSFDVWASTLPRIEIYGTEGSMVVPDPNTFGGPVLVAPAGKREWTEMPITHGYTRNSRGVGVADMVQAIESGRPHRANGELAYHVLDLMHTFHDASREGRHITMQSSCTRPAPFPAGIEDFTIDP